MMRSRVVFLEDRVVDDGGGHWIANRDSRQQTANSQSTAISGSILSFVLVTDHRKNAGITTAKMQ